MAATKRNAMLIEETRKRVQTSQLMNRLRDNGLGKLPKELSASQVRSIEILLRKTIPDLSTVTLEGNENRPVIHRIERCVVSNTKD